MSNNTQGSVKRCRGLRQVFEREKVYNVTADTVRRAMFKFVFMETVFLVWCQRV